MKKLAAIVFAMAFVATAFARLGESAPEIFKRYGAIQGRQEQGTNCWYASYSFKEYTIAVFYTNNVAWAESVRPKGNGKLSDDQRSELMKAIGGEGKWETDYSDGFKAFDTNWKNTSTSNWAMSQTHFFGEDTLTICTPAFRDKLISDYHRDEKKKADGF